MRPTKARSPRPESTSEASKPGANKGVSITKINVQSTHKSNLATIMKRETSGIMKAKGRPQPAVAR